MFMLLIVSLLLLAVKSFFADKHITMVVLGVKTSSVGLMDVTACDHRCSVLTVTHQSFIPSRPTARAPVKAYT